MHTQTTGLVLPVTFAPGNERFEFSVMWADQQLLDRPESGGKVGIVPQQWLLNAMRRWNFLERHRLQPFLAFGLAYFTGEPCSGNPPLPTTVQPAGARYTGCNHLLGSRLNFAEQVGLRWELDRSRRQRIDLSIRHFSNANLVKLNRGQEMLQLLFSTDCQRCSFAR